ncbi:MAG: asparaginase [Flavobacteriales bacterium]|nr:asparaginase [Flavobacteriales bacterium]
MINPVLVISTRAELIESYYRGAYCVVNEHNEIIDQAGEIFTPIFPRSALKFFQVLPLLAAGGKSYFNFTDEEIAVMCASHNAEKRHIEVVHSIMEKAGINEHMLQCGFHPPYREQDSQKFFINQIKPSPLFNNCSGKHAGFLAYCKLKNYATENYLDFNHPLQQEIKKCIAEFAETTPNQFHLGIDGCSAPNFALTLYQLAVAFKNLSTPDRINSKWSEAATQVINSIKAYPMMVAGTERFCTELSDVLGNQVIGKTGAEGVYGITFHQKKLGAGIKTDDGKMGPQYFIAYDLVKKHTGFSHPLLQKYEKAPIINWSGKITGYIQKNMKNQ